MATFRNIAACLLVGAATLSFGISHPTAQTAIAPPLQLEAKIFLGDVRGRIDHMAIDLARQRLFVAELGNDTVAVVDLASRKVVRTIDGLKEPQGVGYVAATDALYVANAGDGSLRVFRGEGYTATGQIALGDDADNIRIEPTTDRVLVGYGNGGLAIIDPNSLQKTTDIPLPAHPESFQLDPGSTRVFVNLPGARAIAVVDRQAGKQAASWPTTIAEGNFAMALHPAAGHVLAIFRSPPKLGVFSMKDGSLVASSDICGDADDLFVDPKRQRIYASCGDGALDVLGVDGAAYQRLARIPTASGARTSLFVPELDRLFLAARAAP